MRDRIILIGYRGVGKTTIGRAVARRMGWIVFDTDEAVEKIHGHTVDEIVAQSGWESFRRTEHAVLASLETVRNAVVATGGGAILHGELWPGMMDTSTIFWLNADMEIIKKRISSDILEGNRRPSLTGNDSVSEAERIFRQREPMYRMYSHKEIDTASQSIENLAEKIITFHKNY
jgi:shikimate kinase